MKNKQGICEYLHDTSIRKAHDTIEENMKKNEEMSIDEYREILVHSYDDDNRLHLKELRWKENALEKYPQKPTYREINRANFKNYQQELLEDFEELEKIQTEEKATKIQAEDEEVI